MPTKKRRIQERGKQPKEAAKGSTSILSWVQSKPAATAAGASQATPCPGEVKEENDSNYMGPHSQYFKAKFNLRDPAPYTIYSDQPCTVLEAIQSNETLKEGIKCADENIIIQLGKEDKECIVATHFPCSCIGDGELVIISSDKKVVEAQDQLTNPTDKIIYPKDKYVVFYIDTVLGKNTKKKVFRNDSVKKFKYLCVYGEKGMTVEEALKRDGRFIDDLGNFYLSDNENRVITLCAAKVDNLHQKSFKVCLPRCKSEKQETPRQNPSSNSQVKCEVTSVGKQSGISVTSAPEKVCLPHCQSEKQETPQQNPSNNSQSKCELTSVVQQTGTSVKTELEKIYERLRQQFPELKKWMECRFPGDSYQEALNLSRENSGKIEQSFSDVHTVRKVLELGESVCRLSVGNVVGTGFVLFDSFILTNAHLFNGYVEGQKLQKGVEVKALFGYDDNKKTNQKTNFKSETNVPSFTAKKTFVDFDVKLDYAILELNPEGQTFKEQTTKVKVPQGLLKAFGPLPQNGEACIIGHPAGGVKKMNPTWIIEKDEREQAVEEKMDPICIIEKEEREQAVEDQDYPFMLLPICQLIKEEGIGNIMMGGNKAEEVVTYHTFMYHGASGSLVVDALGRVFGLHSAGFVYGFPNQNSVIEFAQPVLAIFKKFMDNLRESGKIELLERVKQVVKENSNLKNILTQDQDSRIRE